MSNIRLSEDMIGKEVRLVKIINSYNPDKIGATGVIVDYDEADKSNMHYLVNWNFNGHEWETCPKDEEIEEVVENKGVKDNKEMTNEEIWEMLKSKMEKNGVKSKASIINSHIDDYPNNEIEIIKAYYESDVANAIAIAYRSGYERAMKGRPFKFGEKKKKSGHWEPVNPENLPKEGTKVRYSRECEDYADSDGYICINDTGAIKLEGSWFGVTLDNPHRYKWICFDNAEDCLDMWVEDDE